MVGRIAISENRPTMRVCSRATAALARRACRKTRASQAMITASPSTRATLMASSVTPIVGVGVTRITPARIRKVAIAETSAVTTTAAPIQPGPRGPGRIASARAASGPVLVGPSPRAAAGPSSVGSAQQRHG